MTQSRRMSFVEAWANILVGIGLSFLANLIVLPLLGFPVTLGQNAILTAFFTGLSLVRSYALRRIFNSFKG